MSSYLFGDTVLEVLHYSDVENKFKQLFLIQFHTFFINESGIRFTKDKIDGICKDIRYPDEFFIDLLFDETKSTVISTYEDEVARWKNIISDFILKGYKIGSSDKEVNSNSPVSDSKEENIGKNLDNNLAIQNNIENSERDETIDERKEKTLSKSPEKNDLDTYSNNDLYDKDEDITYKPNTMNKAQEILQKLGGNTNESDEDEEDEEDIENYLKNLENKTK